MRSGQISNETVIVYGVVVAITLVVIGILSNASIFKNAVISSTRCETGAGFACREHYAALNGNDADVHLLLRNEKGFDIQNITITAPTCSMSIPQRVNSTDEVWAILPSCIKNTDDGARVKLYFRIDYTQAHSGVEYTESGYVITTVRG